MTQRVRVQTLGALLQPFARLLIQRLFGNPRQHFRVARAQPAEPFGAQPLVGRGSVIGRGIRGIRGMRRRGIRGEDGDVIAISRLDRHQLVASKLGRRLLTANRVGKPCDRRFGRVLRAFRGFRGGFRVFRGRPLGAFRVFRVLRGGFRGRPLRVLGVLRGGLRSWLFRGFRVLRGVLRGGARLAAAFAAVARPPLAAWNLDDRRILQDSRPVELDVGIVLLQQADGVLVDRRASDANAGRGAEPIKDALPLPRRRPPVWTSAVVS